MAQDDILKIIENHPEGVTGNQVKAELQVNWGVTQQIERLREKGLVNKSPGETRLTWIYTAVRKQSVRI